MINIEQMKRLEAVGIKLVDEKEMMEWLAPYMTCLCKWENKEWKLEWQDSEHRTWGIYNKDLTEALVQAVEAVKKGGI